MAWPDMSRGKSLLVAWSALVSLVALPDVINAQPTAAFGRATATDQGGYQQWVEAFPVAGMTPQGPYGNYGSDACSHCDTPYERPIVGGPTGFRPLHRPLFDLLKPPEGRHRGLGHPLQRESWLYRPFSAGWFMGMVQGTRLIDDWVGQQRGFVGGYRLGWDSDYYWGGELRYAFASVQLFDSPRAIQAQRAADDARGWAANDPRRQRFDPRRDANLKHWDLNVLYYPWGDSQWRPYLLVGVGAAQVTFIDRLSNEFDKAVFAMPLAAGLKYRCNDWLALRFEVADNVAFGGGSGFNTLHNLSVTGGVEIRFGGTRKSYWPWNPGRHYW